MYSSAGSCVNLRISSAGHCNCVAFQRVCVPGGGRSQSGTGRLDPGRVWGLSVGEGTTWGARPLDWELSSPARSALGARTPGGLGGEQGPRPRPPAPTPRARRPLPRAVPIGCGGGSSPPLASGEGRRGPERAAPPQLPPPPPLPLPPPPLPPPPPPSQPPPGEQRASGPRAASSRPALRPCRARQPRRGAPARPRAAATTPRAVLRVKNGAAKLPKPAAAAAAEAPGAGAGMERSQSRLSLSASFEALAIYFPCMNSFDDEDAGKRVARPRSTGGVPGARSRGPLPDPVRPKRWPLFPPHPQSQARSGMRPRGLLSHPRDLRSLGCGVSSPPAAPRDP